MRNECFLDTNVLIYAASTKIDDPRKFAIARDLISRTEFCLSGQVLTEFVFNLAKKFSRPAGEIAMWLDRLSEFSILPVDLDLVKGALAMSQRYHISYWDGAIVAAADRLGAPVLYTEDLNHEQNYGSVKVINPFKVH
jgi:predicted nucleic acid-binding protein